MKDTIITSSNFPIKVLIDGKEFIHYSSFEIRRSIDQFIDTINIDINNPSGRYSTSIPVWSVISIFFEWVELFRWYLETKKVTIRSWWSTMAMGGREEIVKICEDDLDPQVTKFRNTTDNIIITKLLDGKGYKLDLSTPYAIKELNGSMGMTIAQLVSSTMSYNDTIIFKKGNTLYKRSIPTWPTGHIIPIRTSFEWGKYQMYNSDILSISIDEDITQSKGYMMGNTYQEWKSKQSLFAKTENKIMTSWKYASKVRNLSDMKWVPILYANYTTSTAKTQAELKAQVKRAHREADIKASITFTVAWFFYIDLLDTLDIFIEQEKIQQFMYVSSVSYSFDKSNKSVTTIIAKPYPSF